MITRKITFYKPEEKMPEDDDIVLTITSGCGYIETSLYRRGRFYDPYEMYSYVKVEDVEFWASAVLEDVQNGG